MVSFAGGVGARAGAEARADAGGWVRRAEDALAGGLVLGLAFGKGFDRGGWRRVDGGAARRC